MPLFQLFLVAIIQGLTEFLPVSSSGHLVLLPNLTGLDDQGQAIDVAVHVGTLAAVMIYFRLDVLRIVAGAGHTLRGQKTDDSRLFLLLALATVPVVVAGLIFKLTGVDDALRSVQVVAWATILFGLVLWWADRCGALSRKASGWTTRDAVWMGVAQALALVPGTSRSGITISAARFLGFARHDAARLAMLMSIPAIIASGTLLGIEVAATANAATARDGAIAAVLAFLAALGALHFMMRLLRSVSFTPYVLYRLALGAALLAFAT